MYVAMGAVDQFYWINKCNNAKYYADLYRRKGRISALAVAWQNKADWFCMVQDIIEKARASAAPSDEPLSRFVPPPIPKRPPQVPEKTWNEMWAEQLAEERRRRMKKILPIALAGVAAYILLLGR